MGGLTRRRSGIQFDAFHIVVLHHRTLAAGGVQAVPKWLRRPRPAAHFPNQNGRLQDGNSLLVRLGDALVKTAPILHNDGVGALSWPVDIHDDPVGGSGTLCLPRFCLKGAVRSGKLYVIYLPRSMYIYFCPVWCLVRVYGSLRRRP